VHRFVAAQHEHDSNSVRIASIEVEVARSILTPNTCGAKSPFFDIYHLKIAEFAPQV
jgi:hypothetical protein